jgi:hypothetical protein
MVDVFNADRLLDQTGSELRSYLESELVRAIIAQAGFDAQPFNLNCYINDGVTRTRGFHVDSYGPRIKVFVYLTDVRSLDDGPYTFVLGSHVDSPYRTANQTLSVGLPNRTEAPIIAWSNALPVLAARGTVVISDQSGFHRGLPQASSGSRAVAVLNFL